MGLDERKMWLNGALVAWNDATVHVMSQSVQRGSLVFDVMACTGEPGSVRIFGLREHVDRFRASAALNGMVLSLDTPALIEAVCEVVRANPGCTVVKLSAYHAGISLDVLPRDSEPTVAIAAVSLADVYGAEPPERRPARLQIAGTRKLPADVLSPQVKIAAGYTAAAIAKQKARSEHFDDILFLDVHGHVAESSTMSFFLVDEGSVWTAPTERVLAGVTRRCVLELAADEGLAVKEESPERARLDRASEAFLCGTTVDVWPVGRIDSRELPAPVPGPLTARLADRLTRLIAGGDPVFSPRWMQPVG